MLELLVIAQLETTGILHQCPDSSVYGTEAGCKTLTKSLPPMPTGSCPRGFEVVWRASTESMVCAESKTLRSLTERSK